MTPSYQQQIRALRAAEPDPLLSQKLEAASTFNNATVRQISVTEATPLILAYEWLQTVGSARFAYGLYFEDFLASAVCFGSNANNRLGYGSTVSRYFIC